MDGRVVVLKLGHFDEDLGLPSYRTAGAAGADVRACLGRGRDLVVGPGRRELVPTGLAVEIPPGFEIQVRPRSGLSFRTPLMVLNAPGTIDSDYRGEVKVLLGNMGGEDVTVRHGDRIAQFVLAPVVRAAFVPGAALGRTARGAGGFGSTGRD